MLALGLDIGGANLTAATSDGAAVDRPFPLWKQPEGLAAELRSLISRFPIPDVIAVTMTGELADCYVSKAEGVRSIVAAAEAAANAPLFFWNTGGEFLGSEDAKDAPHLVAAANWHALATFCGRVVPTGPALVIDMGSTTTDLIPLRDGCVCSEGFTDLERLKSGELVYTGTTRTPVCSLGPAITLGDEVIPLAAELFATMLDVHLLLGHLDEDLANFDTADGRAAAIPFARSRLARMVCADPDELGDEFLMHFAEALWDRQIRLVQNGLDRVLGRIDTVPHVLLSGSGSFAAEQVVRQTPALSTADVTSLDRIFEKHVSRSACAFAVARLATERLAT
jgi:probable H4MPT-linked C1 transfer pathway protein